MAFTKPRNPHDILATLAYQVVEACNNIIELDDAPMSAKRAALDRSLSFITARRDQCWSENDVEPEADPDEDLL